MAEKLVARSGKVKSLPKRSLTIEVEGSTVSAGDLMEFEGEEGRFRFRHADAKQTEVTVWGPCLLGMKDEDGKAAPWNSAQWRTFKVERIMTVSKIEAAKAKAAEVGAANGEVDYANMTAGQKAAHTKRMRAMAMVAA